MVCASNGEFNNNPGKCGIGIWKLGKQPDPQLQVAVHFLV